ERIKNDGETDIRSEVLRGSYRKELYQLADTLWEKFNRYAKLGLIKDYNKPGMDRITKGLFYIGVVGSENYLDSIDGFFWFYEYQLKGYFSFLYNSMETNLKKLERLLRKKEVYLSAKDYEEAVKKKQDIEEKGQDEESLNESDENDKYYEAKENEEYYKNKAEFISKRFDSKMALEIQKAGIKSETSKLLFKVALTPLLYESGLKGGDSNGGWGEIDYRHYSQVIFYDNPNFWLGYEELEKRVKQVCGTFITEKRTKEVRKKDILGMSYTAYEDYTAYKQDYTPTEQKCIKSLATLELEMNRDIVKWELERMKNRYEDDTYKKELYRLADTLWEKFNRYAKLGLIKDYNKPGMDRITKGLFYIWLVKGRYSNYYRIERIGIVPSVGNFLYFYNKEISHFSFLYESMETNLKKLEELLKDKKVYLSAKEYEEAVKKQQEADKLEKIELLREFIFKSGDIAYNEDKEKLSHYFNKCMSLSDDGAKKKATSWGGEYAGLLDKKYYEDDDYKISEEPLYKKLVQCVNAEFAKIEALKAFVFKDQIITDYEKFDECMSGGEYAELLDKKYYDYDGNSYTTKAEIENTPLYKQLAWCALKETLDKEVSYRQERVFEENWRYRSLYGIEIERVVDTILMKEWATMEKKYPYTDYESTIKNPWYKDEAELQTFINDANKDIAPIFENHIKEYERCDKKMFKSGRKKCKEKVDAKTLKMLEVKLN
ncbi:MAG: hypothetical protein SPJ83_10015, partial [Helicobacter sp.]|uniref:hypothetical protein n=1 Tax=Helicobacter sp. TaxID=218 RepID=UPI002A90B81B